jgi:hypothetical protein
MTAKVFKLELAQIPDTDSAGKPTDDPIGTRINKIYANASMAGFSLVAAYETTLATTPDSNPSAPTHLMLYFQKP